MKPPPFATLLRANADVLWTWIVASGLAWAVQLGEGLGGPSQGLALSSAALPAAVVALIPPRRRRWGMVAVVTLLALLALVNALYHRVFGVYVPLRAAAALSQGWQVRDYVTGLLRAGDALPALAVLASVLGLLARRKTSLALPRRWHTLLPFLLCAVGSLPALGWAWVVSPGSADSETGGFLYAHVVDARRMVGEWRLAEALTPEEVDRVRDALALRMRPPESVDPWRGVAAGSNVLLVQVEALNTWLLDADVEGSAVMPFLRSLLEGSLSFPNVFDQTHEGRSSDADYLVMASQHPLERNAVSMALPSLDPVALADILAGRGYATFSAHAHIPGFWNAAIRHERYGFQESLFEAELGPGESLGFGLLDGVFLERVAPRLLALPEPWLAWLITVTMHGPNVEAPAHNTGLELGALDGTSLGTFYLKARHTDRAVQDLFRTLESAGILARTTVVIYGDHTENHGLDMDRVERMAGVEELPPDARTLLLDRVPILILPPGGTQGGTVGTPGGLVDLAPTLLHLLDMATPPTYMGRTLLGPGPDVVPQASGEVVGDGRMWTGGACRGFPEADLLPDAACDGIRSRARQDLELSWRITRYGLSARLDGDGTDPPQAGVLGRLPHPPPRARRPKEGLVTG